MMAASMAIEHARVAQLERVMGREQLLALTADLATAVGALGDHAPGTVRDLLHRLRGSAASLGFAGLAADIAAAELLEPGSDAAARATADIAGGTPRLVPMMAAALQHVTDQR